jgi:selenocysteine lyase/cysteine desulfurase
LKFLGQIGVEKALQHSTALNLKLEQGLSKDRYRCITPAVQQSPMITFISQDSTQTKELLGQADISVSRSANRIRISPALYNNEADIDKLIRALNR